LQHQLRIVAMTFDREWPHGAWRARRPLRLALQGGGALGAFTWGVLDRLLAEPEFRFDAVSGASAGAMNAVVLASGLVAGGPARARLALERFWRLVGDLPSPWRASPLAVWLHGPSAEPSFAAAPFEILASLVPPAQLNPFDYNPLRAILADIVDFDALKHATARRLYISATDVATGRARIFTNADISIESVLASACLPSLFPAVEIDGRAYWDGGFSANPPIEPLTRDIGRGAVLLVRLDGPPPKKPPRSAREIAGRLAQISANAVLLKDLERVRRLETIALEDALPVHAALNTNPAFAADLKDRGRAAAERFLAARRSRGLAQWWRRASESLRARPGA
jgi:NTE family protein